MAETFELIYKELDRRGIELQKGLSSAEFSAIESTLGVIFPKEIKAFLKEMLPVGDKFFNWRDLSDENVRRFFDFYDSLEKAFIFDTQNNALADIIPTDALAPECESKKAILDYLRSSARIVPFYSHRCFFSGVDDSPIISFAQPIDTIIYGSTFENYLINEFLTPSSDFDASLSCYEREKLKPLGIWYHIVDCHPPIKVTLLGDSIRLIGYGKLLPGLLGCGFDVYQPDENCRYSKSLLRGLFDWEDAMEGSRIVHFNAGLWDTCDLFGDGILFTGLDEYLSNIQRIADILLRRYDKVIFATTTPVTDQNKYHKNSDIIRYNEAVVPLLEAKGVIINDLYSLVASDRERFISSDTIHLTADGMRACAEQSARIIKEAAASLDK